MTLSSSDVRRLLNEHHIRPTKTLGQNFVADPNTVRRIARLAEVGPGDAVVEVGAGLGSLTLALVEAGARVVALEIDPRLARLLTQLVQGRPVSVVCGDALKVRWDQLLAQDPGPHRANLVWSMVANLPYNVATPVVIRVLEEVPVIGSLLVMVQREVGERLAAGPGEEAYGAVSVKVAYWARAMVVAKVPPTVFVPRPRVESVLVRLERRERPAVDPLEVDYRRFKAVVTAGFGQRRKMLRRSLEGVVAPEAFAPCGVRPEARAEEVGLAEWGRLAAWPAPNAA